MNAPDAQKWNGLRRTEFKRSAKQMDRRTGLPRISKKRAAKARAFAKVREAAFERDGYACQGPLYLPGVPCAFGLTPHHVRAQGTGGPDAVDNLISLCVGHHSWVEDHPKEAARLGLWATSIQDIDQAADRRKQARRNKT